MRIPIEHRARPCRWQLAGVWRAVIQSPERKRRVHDPALALGALIRHLLSHGGDTHMVGEQDPALARLSTRKQSFSLLASRLVYLHIESVTHRARGAGSACRFARGSFLKE